MDNNLGFGEYGKIIRIKIPQTKVEFEQAIKDFANLNELDLVMFTTVEHKETGATRYEFRPVLVFTEKV